MTWHDAVGMALSGLRGGMIRSFLTVLGLAVGVGAVVTVLTLGDAGESRVEAEIEKMGVNKVWISAKDDHHHLCAGDAAMLLSATGVPACAGACTVASVRMGNISFTAQVAGFDDAINDVHAPKLLAGRLFRAREMEEGSLVCIVDEAFCERAGYDVIGRYVTAMNRCFRIVGVIQNMTIQTIGSSGGLVIMPLKSCKDTFGTEISEITLSVRSGQSAEEISRKALAVLGGGTGFRADTLENEINAAREVVRIFVAVLVSVSAVCMLTGGIGVMNVLLVSVRERKQEIGLLKAVGGTSGQVGTLFLLEAMAYAVMGCGLGVLLGSLMTAGFSRVIGLAARVNPSTVIPVLLGAMMIGVGFGVLPAMKAARLEPVEALRIE